MGTYVFKLPDIGEGIAESEIAQWRVAVGDLVKEDQPLVDMLTEKAAVEIPSPRAGKVVELRGEAGDKVAVGSPLIVLEVEGEGAADAAPAGAPPPQPSSASAGGSKAAAPTGPGGSKPASTPPPLAGEGRGGSVSPSSALRPTGDKPTASPAVRKKARELGIALEDVPGSGRGGRVTHDDLAAFTAKPQAPATGIGVRREGVEQIKVIGLRRKIAEAMQRAKQRIPHFAYVEEVDVTELEALRVHLNETKRADQPKLTLLPFLMRALVRAVPQFPVVNATYDDEAGIVTRYQGLHVGVATQTPNGLVVPVVRHAEALDVWQSAAEIKRLADAARTGKARREELSGSSITITSLGALGGIVSTPVINAPEVAIVGVNKMVERPVVHGGAIAIRKQMNLSSSFDHRIVDGFDAASFIQRVKQLLEHPATLFMPD